MSADQLNHSFMFILPVFNLLVQLVGITSPCDFDPEWPLAANCLCSISCMCDVTRASFMNSHNQLNTLWHNNLLGKCIWDCIYLMFRRHHCGCRASRHVRIPLLQHCCFFNDVDDGRIPTIISNKSAATPILCQEHIDKHLHILTSLKWPVQQSPSTLPISPSLYILNVASLSHAFCDTTSYWLEQLQYWCSCDLRHPFQVKTC